MTKGYVKEHIPLSIQPRHIDVWKFIESFTRANGFAPLIREIATAVKLNDSRVLGTVNELVNIGALERLPRIKRGLRCVQFPVIPEHMKRNGGKS